MKPQVVKDAAYMAAEKVRRQKEKYARLGGELEALLSAVRTSTPTIQQAEDALSKRLLSDLRTLVEWVYFGVFDGGNLKSSHQHEWVTDAEHITSEYANSIMQGVRKGKFKTGYDLLGFRKHIRRSVRRRAYKELGKAQSHAAIYLKGEDGNTFENPAIAEHAQAAQGTSLPIDALESLTDKARCLLAVLDAYGGDREATAAYFDIKPKALDKRLERIKEAGALENLRLRLIDLGQSEAESSALAQLILPLVPIMQTIPKNSWPASFSALSQVTSETSGTAIGYHATVRKIVLLWRVDTTKNSENEMGIA